MHTERDLSALASKLSDRLGRLRATISSLDAGYTPSKGVHLAHVVIEAANAWALFSRSVFVSSALGARTASGVRVSSTLQTWSSEADVIVDCTLTVKPWLAKGGKPSRVHRRDEPSWHDPKVLEQMWTSLQLSNAADVIQALSMNAGFYIDLPPARNYFAHKNGQTRRVVEDIGRRYGISPVVPFTSQRLRVAEILTSSLPGRPQSLIGEWIDEMDITAELMVT